MSHVTLLYYHGADNTTHFFWLSWTIKSEILCANYTRVCNVLQTSLENYTFLPFSAFLAIFWIFTYKKVPETKNKTFEEILALFRHGNDRYAAHKQLTIIPSTYHNSKMYYTYDSWVYILHIFRIRLLSFSFIFERKKPKGILFSRYTLVTCIQHIYDIHTYIV